MDHSQVYNLSASIDFESDAVVSKTILKKPTGNITLFAFDKGEGLSEHTAPFDALVQVLEGMVEITINGVPFSLTANQSIILPANVPHALKAIEKFKMILTMIKG